QSRTWCIAQAVRDWLDAGPDNARRVSAGQPGDRPHRSHPKPPQATETPPVAPGAVTPRPVLTVVEEPAGPHRHRFDTEVPNSRRGLHGVIYAMYVCDCQRTVERRVKP